MCIRTKHGDTQRKFWLVMSQNVSSKILLFNTQLVLRLKSFWKTMKYKLTVQLCVLESITNVENWIWNSVIQRKIWIYSRFLDFAVQRVLSNENYFLTKKMVVADLIQNSFFVWARKCFTWGILNLSVSSKSSNFGLCENSENWTGTSAQKDQFLWGSCWNTGLEYIYHYIIYLSR